MPENEQLLGVVKVGHQPRGAAARPPLRRGARPGLDRLAGHGGADRPPVRRPRLRLARRPRSGRPVRGQPRRPAALAVARHPRRSAGVVVREPVPGAVGRPPAAASRRDAPSMQWDDAVACGAGRAVPGFLLWAAILVLVARWLGLDARGVGRRALHLQAARPRRRRVVPGAPRGRRRPPRARDREGSAAWSASFRWRSAIAKAFVVVLSGPRRARRDRDQRRRRARRPRDRRRRARLRGAEDAGEPLRHRRDRRRPPVRGRRLRRDRAGHRHRRGDRVSLHAAADRRPDPWSRSRTA